MDNLVKECMDLGLWDDAIVLLEDKHHRWARMISYVNEGKAKKPLLDHLTRTLKPAEVFEFAYFCKEYGRLREFFKIAMEYKDLTRWN